MLKNPLYIAAIIGIVLTLNGCSTNYRVSKSYGWDEQEARQDMYECKQENTRQKSSLYLNKRSGYGSSSPQLDKGMYFECLRARGYNIEIQ